MANLTESPVWEAGVYQLEITDPVLGGPNGVDNLQAKQLANRTQWLRQQIETLQASGFLDQAAADALYASVGHRHSAADVNALLGAFSVNGGTHALAPGVDVVVVSAPVVVGANGIMMASGAAAVYSFGSVIAAGNGDVTMRLRLLDPNGSEVAGSVSMYQGFSGLWVGNGIALGFAAQGLTPGATYTVQMNVQMGANDPNAYSVYGSCIWGITQ